MHSISISRNVHEILLQQLVDLQDSKTQLVDEYFPLPGAERYDFIEFLDNYLNRIDLLLQKAKAVDSGDHAMPFVTLGCEVEVKDMDNGQTYQWRLILPSQSKVTKGCVSCLSPVGKSLLLSRTGETITVKAPRGTARYQIQSAVMAY